MDSGIWIMAIAEFPHAVRGEPFGVSAAAAAAAAAMPLSVCRTGERLTLGDAAMGKIRLPIGK